jgi:hypothetical protein
VQIGDDDEKGSTIGSVARCGPGAFNVVRLRALGREFKRISYVHFDKLDNINYDIPLNFNHSSEPSSWIR